MNSLFVIVPLVYKSVQNHLLTRFSFSLVSSAKNLSNSRHFHASKIKFSSKMTRPSVYLTRKINDEAFAALSKSCDVTMWSGSDPVSRAELLKNIPEKDALFCMLTDRVDSEILDKANKLKVIATMSVGVDHLDVKEIKKRQIKIGYTPDVLTDAVADLSMGLLLAASRRMFEGSEAVRTGTWRAWSPFWMTGPGLKDSTVGIVGFGRIGQAVAKRVKPFSVKKIVYFNRSAKPEAEVEIGATKVSFDDLLQQSDFVVACCALNPDTYKVFNKSAFQKMKKTAVFVNISRGDVVDQDALVDALRNEDIFAAGIDVMTPEPLPMEHPMLELKNLVILPHIGSACIQTRNQMAMMCVDNIMAALEGKDMPTELKN